MWRSISCCMFYFEDMDNLDTFDPMCVLCYRESLRQSKYFKCSFKEYKCLQSSQAAVSCTIEGCDELVHIPCYNKMMSSVTDCENPQEIFCFDHFNYWQYSEIETHYQGPFCQFIDNDDATVVSICYYFFWIISTSV